MTKKHGLGLILILIGIALHQILIIYSDWIAQHMTSEVRAFMAIIYGALLFVAGIISWIFGIIFLVEK